VTTPERPDPLPWQERQRRLREDAVLDAAAELLAERGYASTSMDEIAARVGVSKPTLYQHFPSKDAVAAAVHLRRLATAAVDLDRAEAAVAAGEPARAALERVLHAILARRAGLWATRGEVPQALLDGSPALVAARADVWARIGALVDRAKCDGEYRRDVPTPLILRLFAGLVRGDYLDLVDPASADAPDAMAAALVSLVVDGLAPRGAGEPGARAAIPGRGRRAVQRASAIAGLLLGARTAAQAQLEPPRPLFEQPVPAQTVAVPGVPTKAGGRAPGAPATGAAVSGRPLTLADVLDAALRANPTARASLASAQAARAQSTAARGSYFPTLTFNPGLTRTQTLGVAGLGGLGDPAAQPRGIVNERTQFGPAVGLTFLLFDFGGRAGTVGAAREAANAAEATFDAAVVATVLQAEQAYFGYQSAREVVEAQDANVRTAALSRDAAVARYRAGLATVADTLQAATSLGQARVAALDARTGLANARAALATVANARADAPFAVAADSAPTAAAAVAATAALAGRVDTLVAHALRARPDVDAVRDQALAAAEQVRTARAAQYPAITVTGTGGYQRVPAIPALTGTTYNVQLGLSLPLFDAGARRAGAQAAGANAEAARLRADATTTQAVNQVVASAEQLRVGADRVVASDQLLASAVRNEQVARGRYQEGVGSVVDLLTAQTLLFNARAQSAQARWAWATALAQLSRDAGLLGRRGELPTAARAALPPGTPLLAQPATAR
jgi:outer membrane protein TolC/AcrR family transcriptional regulator